MNDEKTQAKKMQAMRRTIHPLPLLPEMLRDGLRNRTREGVYQDEEEEGTTTSSGMVDLATIHSIMIKSDLAAGNVLSTRAGNSTPLQKISMS